jgi:DNA invertase Pin-like site-specific DNA recombinase
MEPPMTDHAARIAAIACQALAADQNASARVEAALRRELGGQQVRIAERPPITVEAINAGLRERKPVRVIAAELGVSRATLYRHLGKPRKSQAVKAL